MGRRKKIVGRGRKVLNKYATIDPVNFEIIRHFDKLADLEANLGLTNLYPRLSRYENYNSASPFIGGYIVVRYTDAELEGLDNAEITQLLQDKVRGWIVAAQMKRLSKNLDSFSLEELNNLFSYITELEK